MLGKVNFDFPKVNFHFTDLIFENLKPCEPLVTNAKVVASYILGFLAVLFLSFIGRALLRPYHLPRKVPETLVGILAGNIILNQKREHRDSITKTLNDISEFGMIFHMLTLGLEMDPRALFQLPTREAIVGMASTFILAFLLTPFLKSTCAAGLGFTVSLSVALTGTASPLLTRLITDLKIGKSDVGRLLVAAGVRSDLVSTLLIAVGFIILTVDGNSGIRTRDRYGILDITFRLVIQAAVTAVVSPFLMSWMNHENPAGKRLKGSHVALSVAFVVISCGYSVVRAGYNPLMSAFISGICLPREGRLSKMMIGKVLQNAPCSVGILVDRGFGVTNEMSRTSVSLQVAATFIGGKDDREALAYASRVARHPGVKLTILRFLFDPNANSKCTRSSAINVDPAVQEKEMNLDDEFFAGFYEESVGGQVAYMEKYLANSGETLSALRSLEGGQYGLIIVGRGGRAKSVLTAGMNDWEYCPELGPVGDILSGPTFKISASILIIQQLNPKEESAVTAHGFSVVDFLSRKWLNLARY